MSRSLQVFCACLALIYVVVVLLVDTLAMQRVGTPIDWKDLLWHPRDLFRALWQLLKPLGVPLESLSWLQFPAARTFDLSKFCFWLVIPFLFCIPRMDWSWLGFRRMKGRDWLILAMIISAGVAAMSVIPLVPELSRIYPRLTYLPASARWDYFQGQLFWILSWLIGWEFLMRYVLLRSSLTILPAWGWWLVPVVEGIYHLQKPLLEAGGMFALSVVLTYWTLHRRTLMPALMAHLLIEFELLAYQLLY